MTQLSGLLTYILAYFALVLMSIVCTMFQISMLLNIMAIFSAVVVVCSTLYQFVRQRFWSASSGLICVVMIFVVFFWIEPYNLRDYYYRVLIIRDADHFEMACKKQPMVVVLDVEVRSCASFDFGYMNQLDTILLITLDPKSSADINSAHYSLYNYDVQDILSKIKALQRINWNEYSRLLSLKGFIQSDFRFHIVNKEIAILNYDFNMSPE